MPGSSGVVYVVLRLDAPLRVPTATVPTEGWLFHVSVVSDQESADRRTVWRSAEGAAGSVVVRQVSAAAESSVPTGVAGIEKRR